MAESAPAQTGSTQAARIARGKADAEKIFPLLREKFGSEVILEENLENVDPFVVIEPGRLLEVATFLKEEPELGFDLLSLISTADFPTAGDGTGAGHLEVLYAFDSIEHRHRLLLKARLPREDPRLASLEGLWKAADWHEREAFDLMGIHFEGHHNLVRILCAEDWEGHPLRKDYRFPERYHGIKNIVY